MQYPGPKKTNSRQKFSLCYKNLNCYILFLKKIATGNLPCSV